MAKRKLTEGLTQRSNGQWVRAEVIDAKRRFFISFDPEKVCEKRDAAILEANNKKAEKEEGPTFNEVADVYENTVRDLKYGTQKVIPSGFETGAR